MIIILIIVIVVILIVQWTGDEGTGKNEGQPKDSINGNANTNG